MNQFLYYLRQSIFFFGRVLENIGYFVSEGHKKRRRFIIHGGYNVYSYEYLIWGLKQTETLICIFI